MRKDVQFPHLAVLLQLANKLSQILHLVIRIQIRLPQRCLALCTTELHEDLLVGVIGSSSSRNVDGGPIGSPCIRRFCCLVRLASRVATRCSAICNFFSAVFSGSASAGLSKSALCSVVAVSKLLTPTASEVQRRAVIWFAATLRSRHRAPAPSSLHISLLAAMTDEPAATSTCHAYTDGDLRCRARGCVLACGSAINRCCCGCTSAAAVCWFCRIRRIQVCHV